MEGNWSRDVTWQPLLKSTRIWRHGLAMILIPSQDTHAWPNQTVEGQKGHSSNSDGIISWLFSPIFRCPIRHRTQRSTSSPSGMTWLLNIHSAEPWNMPAVSRLGPWTGLCWLFRPLLRIPYCGRGWKPDGDNVCHLQPQAWCLGQQNFTQEANIVFKFILQDNHYSIEKG